MKYTFIHFIHCLLKPVAICYFFLLYSVFCPAQLYSWHRSNKGQKRNKPFQPCALKYLIRQKTKKEHGHPYFAENNFWRQVLRRPTQRPGPAFYSLGKSKVCHLEARRNNMGKVWILFVFVCCVAAYLNVSMVVNEKVLGFQISVYEI